MMTRYLIQVQQPFIFELIQSLKEYYYVINHHMLPSTRDGGSRLKLKDQVSYSRERQGHERKTSSAIDDAHMLVAAAAAQCVGSLLFTQFRLLHMLVSIIITVEYGT